MTDGAIEGKVPYSQRVKEKLTDFRDNVKDAASQIYGGAKEIASDPITHAKGVAEVYSAFVPALGTAYASIREKKSLTRLNGDDFTCREYLSSAKHNAMLAGIATAQTLGAYGFFQALTPQFPDSLRWIQLPLVFAEVFETSLNMSIGHMYDWEEDLTIEKKLVGPEACEKYRKSDVDFVTLDFNILDCRATNPALKLVPLEIKHAEDALKQYHHSERLRHYCNATLGAITGPISMSLPRLAKPFAGGLRAENYADSLLHYAMIAAGTKKSDILEVETPAWIEKHMKEGVLGSFQALDQQNPSGKRVIITNGPSAFAEPVVEYLKKHVKVDGLICHETVFDKGGTVKGLNVTMPNEHERFNLIDKTAQKFDARTVTLTSDNYYDAFFKKKSLTKSELTLVSTERAGEMKFRSDYHMPSWKEFEKAIRTL
jgi:hypothetical protein